MTMETITPQSIERLDLREIERKYRPTYPELLQVFREQSRPIEQFYLNEPGEEYSLRFREELCDDGSLLYVATLKDRGSMTSGGLDRLEVETVISPELYDYYKSPGLASIKKLRTRVDDYVVIDFYENDDIQLEAEDSAAWRRFCGCFESCFVDVTGDPSSGNEQMARKNLGSEMVSVPELDLDEVVSDALAELDKKEQVIIRICGRSGSGKSTIARNIQNRLTELGLTSDVVSSDDYNRGLTWLTNYNEGETWSEWDDPIVYDTGAMALDIQRLMEGQVTLRRVFDFTTQEPSVNGTVEPVSVLIVEGIYAHSPDLDVLDTIKYEVPTPLATCVGRRILRDIVERPQFSDPGASLNYILQWAEPMYRSQINIKG